SRTPRVLTKPTLAGAVHSPPGVAASFSLGRKVLLMTLPNATTARSPAAIYSARFMSLSSVSGVRPPDTASPHAVTAREAGHRPGVGSSSRRTTASSSRLSRDHLLL